jgi:uncharacterized protein (TIRG00374 family)
MNKKLFFGLAISVLAIGFLLYRFDLSEFKTLQDKWNPWFIVPVVISNIWAMFIFAIRWYYLLEKKLSFRKALLSSFLGVGANMVLPARGGDILRIYYCKSESTINYPTIVSKLFLEKVIDLTIVILIGAGSFILLGLGKGKSSPEALFFSGFIVAGLIIGLIMIRFANKLLVRLGRWSFSIIGKEKIFINKLESHLIDLSQFLTWKNLSIPLLLTIPTWLLGYSITYMLQSYLIGIPLTYVQVLFMVFCGAMGVALPSAPSGVGVFHASLISGFILLGLGSSEGFLYATAVHLMQFILLSFFALIAYSIWMGGLVKLGKKKIPLIRGMND